jgi:hypothetical protein
MGNWLEQDKIQVLSNDLLTALGPGGLWFLIAFWWNRIRLGLTSDRAIMVR